LQRLDDLVQENELLKSEVASFRETASKRQVQLEETVDELGTMVKRIEELEIQAATAGRRAERAQGDTDRARAAQQKAEEELEAVREDLKKEVDKELMSQQRRRIGELETELEKSKERVTAKDKDIEYMRTEYQRASAAAVEARGEVSALQEENAQLRVKADGEFVRLRMLAFDDQRIAAEDRVKDLSFRVEFLEEQLKRVSDNEKSTSRSRYTSRASSVPRRTKSPASYSRLGSPSV
jgi:chromosome segregation ATPase